MKKYAQLILWATAVTLIVIGCQSNLEPTPAETAVSPTQTPIPEIKPTEAAAIALTDTAVSSATPIPINLEGLKTYTITPSDTDPAISQQSGKHSAYFNPAIAPRNQLVVILPGTKATPNRYTQFGITAAAVGLHTVSLVYENQDSISSLCKNSDDQQCAENVRLEIINGSDLSAKVAVNRANSIENRLLRLLQYLHREQPTEGWNQYFQDETINWERLIVVGHSQGGGHAGLLARDYVVARVVFFNSPSDFKATSGTTANWIQDQHRTPSENYYAFFHQDDGGRKRVQVYQDFGMAAFGTPVDVDQNRYPYEQSHMLFTQIPSDNPHVAVIGDPFLPLDDEGIPLYRDAWVYLLTYGGN